MGSYGLGMVFLIMLREFTKFTLFANKFTGANGSNVFIILGRGGGGVLELLRGLVIAQLHKVFNDADDDDHAYHGFLLKVIPVFTLIVGCISLTFLQCAFSNVGSQGDPRVHKSESEKAKK